MLEKLHCLHFCANAPKMSIFLGKPIKGATNMTSALQHCKTNFFCKFSWPYCIQSKYADVFKKCIFVLDWSTRCCFCIIQVIFVTFPAKKRPEPCMQSFYCTLWQKDEKSPICCHSIIHSVQTTVATENQCPLVNKY